MNATAAIPVNDSAGFPPASSVSFGFGDQRLLAEVCGPMERHIDYISRRMDVTIGIRGTTVEIYGNQAELAQAVIRDLYRIVECAEQEVTSGLIDAKMREFGLRSAPEEAETEDNIVHHAIIRTRKKNIIARNASQTRYIHAMQREEMTFGLGPAGTGKTYLAVAEAVSQLIQGNVDRIILSRPAIDAGEKLGFLPGDMKEKLDPYLRPLYDALHDCLPGDQVEKKIAGGEIEIAPIAFMRGRTMKNAFVILDEAQNATPEQMKMFLTRMGEGSRYVICGDPNQTDLPGGSKYSGLADATAKLEGVEGIAFTRFAIGDVVRHPIVGRIVNAYEGESASE